jgi:hypothetical protein
MLTVSWNSEIVSAVMNNNEVTKSLKQIAANISTEVAQSVHVGPYSAEDDTPTMHVELWRKLGISDLPYEAASLDVASEGYGEYGRCYSLQIKA